MANESTIRDDEAPGTTEDTALAVVTLVRHARQDIAVTLERLSSMQWLVAEQALAPVRFEGVSPKEIARKARRQRMLISLMQQVVDIDNLALELLRMAEDPGIAPTPRHGDNVVPFSTDPSPARTLAGYSLATIADMLAARVRRADADLRVIAAEMRQDEYRQ